MGSDSLAVVVGCLVSSCIDGFDDVVCQVVEVCLLYVSVWVCDFGQAVGSVVFVGVACAIVCVPVVLLWCYFFEDVSVAI